jgi:hypothetical protein
VVPEWIVKQYILKPVNVIGMRDIETFWEICPAELISSSVIEVPVFFCDNLYGFLWGKIWVLYSSVRIVSF